MYQWLTYVQLVKEGNQNQVRVFPGKNAAMCSVLWVFYISLYFYFHISLQEYRYLYCNSYINGFIHRYSIDYHACCYVLYNYSKYGG